MRHSSTELLKRAARLALAAALPLACGGCGGETGPPPSVLLISLDTLRADHMSLYGYERETTPYLRQLAKECLVFDQAHSVAPWTLISHVTMLTGLYPEQHGVVKKDKALSPKIPFLAQRLSDQGYHTIGLYKPGFIGPRYGHDRGFDVFREHEEAPLAEIHLSEAFVDLNPEWPFFLFLHLFDIHGDPLKDKKSLMYDPPEPFDICFMPDAKKILRKVNFILVDEGRQKLEPLESEAMIALYDGKIRYVDSVLEDWIESWRRRGLLDNAILIITADHGENLGHRRNGDLGGHGKLFEEGLHIPLLVRFPDGYRAGERSDALVSLVDVVPTVLEAARLPLDPRLPGVSLRGPIPEERVVGAQKGSHARMRWPWKLQVVGFNSHLVNLEEDPLEQNPLTEDDPRFGPIATGLLEDYKAQLAARPGFDAPAIPALEAESDELQRELEALGYAGED